MSDKIDDLCDSLLEDLGLAVVGIWLNGTHYVTELPSDALPGSWLAHPDGSTSFFLLSEQEIAYSPNHRREAPPSCA